MARQSFRRHEGQDDEVTRQAVEMIGVRLRGGGAVSGRRGEGVP